jgi:hypothetical protein
MPVYQLTLFIIYFSVSSAAKNNCVNLCESVKSVVKNLSIKNESIMRNKPNFRKAKNDLNQLYNK